MITADEARLAEQLAKSEAWVAVVRDVRAARMSRRNVDRERACAGCGRLFCAREPDQRFHSLACARRSRMS